MQQAVHTPLSRPATEADLFAVGGMATITSAPVVAECMGSQHWAHPCAHKHRHIDSQVHTKRDNRTDMHVSQENVHRRLELGDHRW